VKGFFFKKKKRKKEVINHERRSFMPKGSNRISLLKRLRFFQS